MPHLLYKHLVCWQCFRSHQHELKSSAQISGPQYRFVHSCLPEENHAMHLITLTIYSWALIMALSSREQLTYLWKLNISIYYNGHWQYTLHNCFFKETNKPYLQKNGDSYMISKLCIIKIYCMMLKLHFKFEFKVHSFRFAKTIFLNEHQNCQTFNSFHCHLGYFFTIYVAVSFCCSIK